MKRLICILLVSVLSLAAFGCGEDPAVGADETGLQVGFGKVDITPDYPVHLGAYNNTESRISQGVADEIYAIALVMTDPAGTTTVMITADIYMGTNTITNAVRAAIQEKFGISGEYVTVGGIHNHNAPDYSFTAVGNNQFREDFLSGVLAAVQQAMDDRAPANIYVGRTNTEDLNFVRRYKLADGSVVSASQGAEYSGSIVDHESEADSQIQMVRFVREGTKDIMIVNWQTFVGKHGNTPYISADFIGPLRDAVESSLDVHCVYYEGAAGNLTFSSQIEGEGSASNGTGWDAAVAYGEKIAEYVVDAWEAPDNFTEVDSGNISVTQTKFIGQQTWAEANALAVGELSFVTLPAEFFDSLGMSIKEKTPYEMTILMGYTCAVGQYLPSELGFSNGGYEAQHTQFISGEGEKFVQFYLEILHELHTAN